MGSTRKRLLASTIIIGAAALGAAGVASAQPSTNAPIGQNPPAAAPTVSPDVGQNNPQPASANGQTGSTAVQEVVVTGSRIRSPNLSSNSPLTVVNSQAIQQQGATNIVDVLNQLPSITPDQNSNVSNASTGTANINLRDLGAQRTLVLIDGRRLGPGDASSQPIPAAADVNFIPAALVDRVDVVTGGASAVYGSDAIAGVVNFIMKKNFQGVQLDAQGSFFNHQNGNKFADEALNDPIAGRPADSTIPSIPGDVGADGRNLNISLVMGANSPDEKGNVTAYATYVNVQPVLQSSRDFSDCAVADLSGTGFLQCAGSSNTPYGRFGGNVNNPNGTNSFIPYNGNNYSYDTSPTNYLQRNDNRYNAGFFAHYKVNDHFEAYSDFMFMDDQTDAQIAPSGLFRGTGPYGATNYTINCNNPFLGATQVAALCPGVAVTPGAAGGMTATLPLVGYRFADNPRIDNLRHTDYKIDVGARGDIGQGWTYDAYVQYGISMRNEEYLNDVSTSRVQNALNVVDVNGVPTCASTAGSGSPIAGSSLGCVPLNIFQSLGKGITPAALNYVIAPGFSQGQATEQIASVNVTGDLGQYGFKSPMASDGVGVALGTEYRREAINLQVDEEFQTGDLSGQGGATLPAAGSFDVYEIFGEVRVPLVSNRPFVKDLSFDGGYRFSDYSSIGVTNTYKGELTWSPIDDFRFRGSYNHAVRAPSVEELYAPRNVNLTGYPDPCSSDELPGASLGQCEATGETAAQYAAGGVEDCTLQQCSQEVSGNPNLRPETADSYTAGMVFQPRFIRNFAMSADFYSIKVNNIIEQGYSNGDGTTIIESCLGGSAAYCNLIHRDPSTGILFGPNGYVNLENVNGGFLRTKGVDMTATYRTRFTDWGLGLPDMGSLTFAAVATYTLDHTLEPGKGAYNVGTYNCAGLYGATCGQPLPHWRSSLRTTWTAPNNIQVSLNWRHVGEVAQDSYSNQTLLYGADAEGPSKIDGYNYFDLEASWKVRDHYTFRVGVNNIMDKDPPVVSQDLAEPGQPFFGNGNTYPGVYDALGRMVFAALTADF